MKLVLNSFFILGSLLTALISFGQVYSTLQVVNDDDDRHLFV